MTILVMEPNPARLRAQIADGRYVVPEALLAEAILERLKAVSVS